MAVYKGRRPGTWRVVIWSMNRRHEKLIEGSKADALAFEATWRLQLRSEDSPAVRAGLTFADFCTRHYREHAERHLGPSTWVSRRCQLTRICSSLGAAKLATISTAMVEAYKAQRVQDGMRPSTVNSELRVISAALSWARRSGHQVGNPALKMVREKGPPRVRAFSSDELGRLFDACSSTAGWLAPMAIFLANTGLRSGELIAADWSWVDAHEKVLRIPTSREWSPKSGKAREVPLSDAAISAMGSPHDSGALFPSRYGRKRLGWPTKHWRKAVKRAGLTGGAHQLRHTFASHYLAAGGTMFDLARILGHSTQTTTERYSHFLPERMAATRNLVNVSPKPKTVAARRGRVLKK